MKSVKSNHKTMQLFKQLSLATPGENNHRAPAALEPRFAMLQFSTALWRTAFFLAALSPREFRRVTEAGSGNVFCFCFRLI